MIMKAKLQKVMSPAMEELHKKISALGFDPEDIPMLDDVAECAIGLASLPGAPPMVCYDTEKVIALLKERNCSTEEEAREFLYDYLLDRFDEQKLFPYFLQPFPDAD